MGMDGIIFTYPYCPRVTSTNPIRGVMHAFLRALLTPSFSLALVSILSFISGSMFLDVVCAVFQVADSGRRDRLRCVLVLVFRGLRKSERASDLDEGCYLLRTYSTLD